jgi:hypothetical protein
MLAVTFNESGKRTVGFYIYDRALMAVRDAKVWVNGARVPFDATYDQYRIMVSGSSRIEVQHPDFEPLTYDAFPWLSNRLFLHHDEDVAYYAAGVKVACLPLRSLLFVWMRTEEDISDLCDRHGLVIKERPSKGGYRTPPKVCVLQANDPLPPSEIDELASLRSDDTVRFAGPLLTHDERLVDIAGLTSSITVTFEPNVDEPSARSMMEKGGLAVAPARAYARDRTLTVRLEAHVGLAAADTAAELSTLPGVVLAENEITQTVE